MTPQGLLGTSQESRSTFAGSMGKRGGSVKGAQSVMQFNQIGKLTLRFVALESIDVIVELFSLGKSNIYANIG
jgi:hypothetical protein